MGGVMRTLVSFAVSLGLAISLVPAGVGAEGDLVTVERFVPHASTVPATEGDAVRL